MTATILLFGFEAREIDWDAVLADIGWLHFSAISPALNQQLLWCAGNAAGGRG